MQLTVTTESTVHDEGTVVVIDGIREDGRHQFFAADHGPAQDLLAAVQTEGEAIAEVDGWQLLGGPR